MTLYTDIRGRSAKELKFCSHQPLQFLLNALIIKAVSSFTEAEISNSTRVPWYIFGAVSAAVTFALLAATIALTRFLQNRRKDRQQIHEEQLATSATSQAGNNIKQDLVFVRSFTNPAYTSSTNDLRSKGFRHEIRPIKVAWAQT